MDLFETTFKVVQNRSVARESLTLCRQDVGQYEKCVSRLKNKLQKTQAKSSQNTKTLEVNNFTKRAFNENSKESKLLFGLIYGYVQQIEQNLATITQNENSLEDLCNENAERLKIIQTNFTNSLKIIEIMKKNIHDQLGKEADEMNQKINVLNAEQEECDELWKNIVDQYEEKQQILSSTKLELEILQDNIDLEIEQQELLVQEKKGDNQKIINDINDEIEINDRILHMEATMLITSQQLKELLECKSEIMQKWIQSEKVLEKLEKEHSDLEIQINETKNENIKFTESLVNEIELKKTLIKENEIKLSTCNNRTNEINRELEAIALKLAGLSEELENSTAEDEEFLENNTTEKITKEHEQIVENSKNFLNMISEIEIKIRGKQDELDLIKSAPDPELQKIEDQMKTLELERRKTPQTEEEIEEIDSRNKNMQQSVEQHQTAIKDFIAQKAQVEIERDENQKQLKNLMVQCDNLDKEIRRLEVLKQENINLFPAPPLKRMRNRTQPAKKRGFVMDAESDSSVDGERLSYAEFIAKKKSIKDNKKQKR